MTFKEFVANKGIGLNELYRRCNIKKRTFYYFVNGTYSSIRVKNKIARELGITIKELEALERKKNPIE